MTGLREALSTSRRHAGRSSTASTDEKDSTSRRPATRPGRYGLVLALLVGVYLLSSFVTARWVTALQIVLFGAALVLALGNSGLSRRMSRLVFLVVFGGTAITFGLSLGSSVNVGVSYLWMAVVLLGAVVVIVYRVLAFGTVTLDSIFGAVSAYLVLGMMFAAIFGAIDHLGGGHFFAGGQPATFKHIQYFSFTTLTTLGYGDFTAAGSGGRSVAMLEALTGQVFLATLVARLVAAFRGPAERRSDRGSP